MNNILKFVIMAFGLFFLSVGIQISVSGDSTYAAQISPLQAGVTYAMFGFIAFGIMQLFVSVMRQFLELWKRR